MKARDRAWEGFTRRVLAGEILPGQFVTQRELAEITGYPLGAIRELVPRLEAEGLIVTAPQRGLQVAQADLKLVRNAFQFREFLEVPAVRHYARVADPGELAGLRAEHEAVIERRTEEDDNWLMQDAELVDLRLHEAIIGSLDNEIVSNAYRVNWIKIKLIRLAETRLYVPMIPQVMGEHLKVIHALERRDADAAAEAVRSHIDVARRRAVDI
ncbi:GntR family transcriptional regulator [Tropicimonas sp.]|uniref:GntR family transcriptional regulator n=1 Tax=Tropicimonas sp. TaxID=2067044 RepID=UPI003A88C44B